MTTPRDAVIVDAVRTPVGRYGGALKDVRPDDLAALVIQALIRRNNLDPASIDDVIFGCTNQAGEDNRNVARMAVLLAGLPVAIPLVDGSPRRKSAKSYPAIAPVKLKDPRGSCCARMSSFSRRASPPMVR